MCLAVSAAGPSSSGSTNTGACLPKGTIGGNRKPRLVPTAATAAADDDAVPHNVVGVVVLVRGGLPPVVAVPRGGRAMAVKALIVDVLTAHTTSTTVRVVLPTETDSVFIVGERC